MKSFAFALLSGSVILAGCASPEASTPSAAEVEKLKQQLAVVVKARDLEQGHLTNFDDLDFNVYSSQKWSELGRSHAPDIVVHYPDGHTTKGIDAHIEEMKGVFVFAPDTKIKQHPIRIASGDWTAVMGAMEGTFSAPMPSGNGKTIPATGKSFNLTMVTIGHWKNGVMDEEWLQWDNASFMKQLGLSQ